MSEPTPDTAPPLDERLSERDRGVLLHAAAATPDRDPVDESSDASFPASDPPSWWSGR